jgi:hypothetical protein
MKISLVRTGGVAGMRQETMVDTATLDPGSAGRFHRLVAAADMGRLPEPTLSVHHQPDSFRYALKVEDGVRTHTVLFEEHREPERLEPLIAALQETGVPTREA